MNRKPYPRDVSDEEWAFVAPYLTLKDEDAPQRAYPLREVFNARRWLVKTGAHWRMMPHDLPAWPAVDQQTRRWLAAGVFAAIVHDLRVLLRLAPGVRPSPRRPDKINDNIKRSMIDDDYVLDKFTKCRLRVSERTGRVLLRQTVGSPAAHTTAPLPCRIGVRDIARSAPHRLPPATWTGETGAADPSP